MKYDIGDEFYSANYEICQTSDDRFVVDWFVKRVEIVRIEIRRDYGRSIGQSNIVYYTTNMQNFRENEDPRELGLFLDEKEAKKAAKEKAIMAGKLEIRNYESIIKDKQKRIKELKQSIKELL